MPYTNILVLQGHTLIQCNRHWQYCFSHEIHEREQKLYTKNEVTENVPTHRFICLFLPYSLTTTVVQQDSLACSYASRVGKGWPALTSPISQKPPIHWLRSHILSSVNCPSSLNPRNSFLLVPEEQLCISYRFSFTLSLNSIFKNLCYPIFYKKYL